MRRPKSKKKKNKKMKKIPTAKKINNKKILLNLCMSGIHSIKFNLLFELNISKNSLLMKNSKGDEVFENYLY